MLSDKPFTRSRANAPESTESRPDDCLQASAYGNTGHVVILPADDLQSFNRFTTEIEAELAPETAIERQLAHFYAACQWRMNRAAALEDTLFGVGITEGIPEKLKKLDPKVQAAIRHALTLRNLAEVFEKIGQYSQSLVHQGGEVLGQLKECQAERKRQVADTPKTGVAAG